MYCGRFRAAFVDNVDNVDNLWITRTCVWGGVYLLPGLAFAFMAVGSNRGNSSFWCGIDLRVLCGLRFIGGSCLRREG